MQWDTEEKGDISMKLTKRHGVISVLVGTGVLFLSVLFSTGSNSQLTVVGNIEEMRIVIKGGRSECIPNPAPNSLICAGSYEIPEVSIPLRYMLSLSVVLILSGAGIIFTREGNS